MNNCYLTFAIFAASIDLMLAIIVFISAPVFGLTVYGLIATVFAVCLLVGTPLAFMFTGFCFMAAEEVDRG